MVLQSLRSLSEERYSKDTKLWGLSVHKNTVCGCQSSTSCVIHTMQLGAKLSLSIALPQIRKKDEEITLPYMYECLWQSFEIGSTCGRSATGCFVVLWISGASVLSPTCCNSGLQATCTQMQHPKGTQCMQGHSLTNKPPYNMCLCVCMYVCMYVCVCVCISSVWFIVAGSSSQGEGSTLPGKWIQITMNVIASSGQSLCIN